MPYTAQDRVYLSDLSPRDARFDRHRADVDRIIDLYRASGHDGYSDRMKECSRFLDFALHFEENGVLSPKLQCTHFCRVRLCSICQWRRSMSWQAKTLKIMPKVIEDNPKARFIFLTLTVKNCELNELRGTLGQMHNSWRKLVKRKEWAAVQGWVRSVEVTRGADDTAHTHYHALLMVSPGYFTGHSYVSQKRWTEAWQSCLGVGYTPIVDVRSVRPGKRQEGDEGGVLMSAAICETLKYTVKPSECLVDDSRRKLSNSEWLSGLTSQLFKTRAIATGGILKQYLKELEQEPEDLIHIDEENSTPVDDEAPRLAFAWHKDKKRYQMVDEAS